MRKLLVLLSLVAFPAAASRLELEVGAGAESRDASPMWTGRVGIDFFNFLTPSLRAIAASPANGRDASAWALLGELHAHTRGRVQLTGGIGIGFGNAFVVNADDGLATRVQRTGAYVLGDLGVRLRLRRFFVGLSLGASPTSRNFLASLSLGVSPFGWDEDC